MELNRLYRPITSTPLGRRSYIESAPCAALQPYVRCFWRSLPVDTPPTLVIPDTCMDLLFMRGGVRFCALGDEPFVSTSDGDIHFAIRFYPWATALFADVSLTDTLNLGTDARIHFERLVRELLEMLARTADFDLRCQRAEAILWERLNDRAVPPDVLNAVHAVLASEGRVRTAELALHTHVSPRQLERLFARAIGAGPKKFASLVRYQSLWRAAAFDPRFDVQDAVERFGYADQSHLLREFKRYHSLTLPQAVALARQEVAFLQYKTPPL